MSEEEQKLEEDTPPAADDAGEQPPNTYMIRPNFAHKYVIVHESTRS